jgi:3-oxoadipate enol-lactonase
MSINVHYRLDGDTPEAVPTVLIHGVGSDLVRWDSVTSALTSHARVVRYDLRGHGRSPRPAGRYEIGEFVADHLALMDKLGIERAHVVGMSLGGLIAQAFTLSHPERVASAGFICTVAGRSPEQRAAVQARLRAVEEGGPAVVADSGGRWYTDSFRAAHPEVVQAHMRRFVANDPVAYAAAFRVLATTDLLDQLSAITVPTLIMTGALDVGSPPEMSRAMHERIPDSRLVIVDGVKHAILEEAPNTVADVLGGFLYGGSEESRRPIECEELLAAR